MNIPKLKIGIIGGSGFYKLLDNPKEIKVETPYGEPSDAVMVGKYKNVPVAFLPRHGRHHQLPPHKINYKANLWALNKLEVHNVLAPCACGSLQPKIKPGEFVIVDQFVNKTFGRDDTYFHGPDVVHISTAEPYCPHLRQEIYRASKKLKIKSHFGGTAVVINGPRFSTRSESQWFSQQGWEVINMTNYPESVLARELGMCYAAICLVTDYDAGIKNNPKIKPVTMQEITRTFKQNNAKAKKLLLHLIKYLPSSKICKCHEEVEKGKVN